MRLASFSAFGTITSMDAEYRREEARLRESAAHDLEAFAVAQAATGKLAEAIEGSSIGLAREPAPAEWYVRAAILNLCVVGLRAARACMGVIAAGYEPEAQGLKRRVMEVCARMSAVVEDESGEHARLWLEGRSPSTPRKIAGKFTSLALFDLYSRSTHADGRGVVDWLAVPMPEVGPHHTGLITTPNRRPENANAMLVELAHECRDLALIMAASRRVEIELAELDTEIYMEHAGIGPHADFIDQRECDFAEALAALHELVGRDVVVSVLGGLHEGGHAPLVLRGWLCCGYELGRGDDSALCFELPGVLLFVSPDTLVAAWRNEYRRLADERHWLVVTPQYDGGAQVELEQLI